MTDIAGSNVNLAVVKTQMAFVYKSDGTTFIDVLRDAPLLAGFKEAINAATAPLQITLPRKFDNFDEAGGTGNPGTIGQGNVVKWYIYGPGLPATGLLRYQGIIDAFAPQILDTGEENLTVTIVPYSSVLADHGLPGSVTIGTIGGTGQDTVVHFDYWFTTTDSITGKTYMSPFGLDSSNPATSGHVTSYIYNNENMSSIFTTIMQMSPPNWFFRMNDVPYGGNTATTLTTTYNVSPSTAQHVFYIGQNVSSVNFSQDWTQLKNVIYVTGASIYNPVTQTYTTITATATGSDLATFGERLLLYNDSRITDQATATIIAQSLLAQNDLVLTNATVRVLDYRGDQYQGLGYDIETIRVGDTCQVLNPTTVQVGGESYWDEALWDSATWDYQPGQELDEITIIAGLTYGFDYVDLELATFMPNQDNNLFNIQQRFQDFTMGTNQY